MKILYVTNMFPTKKSPAFGIFVKEQIQSIASTLDCQYDLYFINATEQGNWQYLKSIFALPYKMSRGRYDIVHIHYGISGLFLLFFKPRAKTFLTLHGADILEKQGRNVQVFFTKLILRKVHKVFILNKEMEDIIAPLNANYEIIPCGVDMDFFKPVQKRRLNTNNKLILFPGDPSVIVKNFSMFEKVILLLKARSPYEIRFQCIKGLTRLAVRDLMNEADCMVMTSLSEGSPQVIKEALACDLPVVSVPVGDVNLMVSNTPNCRISETYSANELCDLVLLSLKQDRNGIRKAFTDKKIYDQRSVTRRIIESYIS